MKILSSSVIGSSHSANGTPCQDFTKSFKFNNFRSCIVLCDGAGSSIYSHISSQRFVNILGEYFSSSMRRKSKSKIKKEILKLINQEAKKITIELGCSNKDIYSTLLFVYVDKKKGDLIYGHSGDGVIAESRRKNFKVLSKPDNGEYSNSTFFINSRSANHHFRVTKTRAEKSVDGYIIMSDGAEESLYNKKTYNMAPATNVFLSWLKTANINEVQTAIDKALSEQLSTKTTDDISLSILSL